MQKVDRIINQINRVIRLISSYLMLIIVTVMVVQVFYRYVLNNSIIWSEEFCMVILIWLGFFCISTEVYRGGHMSIEVLYNKFPPKVKLFCDILRNVIITLFSGVMIVYTIKVALIVGKKKLPISQLPKVLIYVPVIACAVLMTAYGIVLTIQTVMNYKRKDGEKNE